MRRRALHLLSAATAALVAGSAAFFVTTANAEVDHAACRPDGLYQTPGVTVPYCKAYDTDGREKLGADHGRRIIGYFTSWRTGKNGAPAYLASQIPWDKVTHVNYAFAHVDGANKISVGTPGAANNAATNMTWPGTAGADDGPGVPVHRPLQPAQQVQEAAPGGEDADQRRRLGGDGRLLRRQRRRGSTPAASTG